MKRISTLVLFFLISTFLFGEDSKINYNSYYRSPLTLGANYTSFNPLSGFNSGPPFNIFDLTANLRYTPLSIPRFQPELILGMTKFDSQNSEDSKTWDSSNYFGMTGIRFMQRSTKNFEFGLGLHAGAAQGVFNNLAADPAGTIFALGQGAVYLGLSPSYNMTLELSPSIRYQHSTDPNFTEMNGFLLGIGGTISFRFGRDPDSPENSVKSIRFKDLQIDPLFAAMQNYYRENSFGTVTIENTDKVSITDLTVSFYQSGYMDAPTIIQQIDELGKEESLDVPLKALFNKEIFLTEGITPLTGEIRVSYLHNNRPVEQSYPVSYDLYDKTSLIWNDDRKVASFITPADSALQNYSSFIRKSCKDNLIPQYNDKLQGAIQIYQALKEIGVIYQVDPLQPFASVSDSENLVVDSISLPRTTLSKLTGDCDDLTVLYLSLLETIGIETAFITVPGHIYTAFNTGEDSRSYNKINPDRSKTIDIDGKLWVPLEITLVGKSSFMSAWNKGAEEWNSLEETPEKRKIYLRAEAGQTYRPIGLTEKDLGLQYGDAAFISKAFSNEMKTLTNLILSAYYQKVEERKSKQNYNRLGIALAGFNRISMAEKSFRDALKLDSDYLSPRVNISNLKYLNKDYSAAVGELEKVISILDKIGKGNSNAALVTSLNLSKVYYAMENFAKAEEYYETAHNISPEKTEGYAYLASIASNTEGSRAAEVKEDQMIFLDDEE